MSHQMEWPAPASSFQYVSMDARMHRKGLPWMVLPLTVVAPPQWYAAAPSYVALLCSRCVSSSRTSPCQFENAPPRVAWLSSHPQGPPHTTPSLVQSNDDIYPGGGCLSPSPFQLLDLSSLDSVEYASMC